MHALLLATVLAAPPTTITASVDEATATVGEYVTTGTLLFSRGDCLAVKVYTASPYTHVAAVVREGNRAYVYDAANGVGVRKLPLDEYIAAVRPDRMHVVNPSDPFTPKRTALFVARLEGELGRPYGVAHHLTGERATGLHCAEYVTDALMQCRLIHANAPSRVSPASLHAGVTGPELYGHVMTLEIAREPVPTEVGSSWCDQMWIDTKTCTANFCRKLGRVVLCR